MLLPMHAVPPIFSFQVNNTQIISGLFSTIAGKTISVDWGDGSARSTYSGTDQAWSKDYGSAGNRTVRIFGAVVLTKFQMDRAGADISFDVANAPTGLTHLYVYGSNTLTGDIANAPTGLIYLAVGGNNTIADYTTPHTWTTKPATFILIPVAPGGLSTAEIDNLLIDLDDDFVWTTGTINLTGTNAARSSNSDAAVTSMTGQGATVTTN